MPLARHAQLLQHQSQLRACARCPAMHGTPVVGAAVLSPVILIGQAPGSKEITIKRPFAWTAGKTLFRWFDQIGLPETLFRQRIYMAAVCRCFPGKNVKAGDRVPDAEEIRRCAAWLQAELELLQPGLIIPVGKLAIAQLMPVNKLADVVGRRHQITRAGRVIDVVPLPHPSGASVWHRVEPGKTLLTRALKTIAKHPAWRHVIASNDDVNR